MHFIKNLFSKTQELPPADLSVLHTDIHSHLIPGIDDGSQTVEQSIELITELHQLGYKKLITTPHIMSDHYKNTPEIILGGLQKMREALYKENIPVELDAAAEYYIDYDFESKIKQKELLSFGDNHVLFELSFYHPPESLDKIIFDLQTTGYKPVLAHVERYVYWHNDMEMYEKLKYAGVLMQLNILSLSKSYSPQIRKAATFLIDNDMIDLLGTDCHNMQYIEILKSTLTERSLHDVLNSGKLINDRL